MEGRVAVIVDGREVFARDDCDTFSVEESSGGQFVLKVSFPAAEGHEPQPNPFVAALGELWQKQQALKAQSAVEVPDDAA